MFSLNTLRNLFTIILLIMVSTACASTGRIGDLNNLSENEFVRVFGRPQWVEYEFYDCSDDSNYVDCNGIIAGYGLSYNNYMWKLQKLDRGGQLYLMLSVQEISERQGDLFHFEPSDTQWVYINLLDRPRGMKIE